MLLDDAEELHFCKWRRPSALPCITHVLYFSLFLTVYPGPLQCTCGSLAWFIKHILRILFFCDLTLKWSLYRELARIPTNLFAFDILTVLSTRLASVSSRCCIRLFSTDVSIQLATFFPTCVSCDHLRTNPSDSHSV